MSQILTSSSQNQKQIEDQKNQSLNTQTARCNSTRHNEVKERKDDQKNDDNAGTRNRQT